VQCAWQSHGAAQPLYHQGRNRYLLSIPDSVSPFSGLKKLLPWRLCAAPASLREALRAGLGVRSLFLRLGVATISG